MGHVTRILLLRHGEVAPEWHGRLYGGLDVPLSPVGEAQAAASARALDGLRLDLVVSSGLARAEASAAHLRSGRPGLERRDVPALKEIDRGAWAGRTWEAIEAEWPGAHGAWLRSGGRLAPPGGETLERMAGRVLPALDALAREVPGGTVAVAGHLWVLRLAACCGLGLPFQRCTRIGVGYGGRLELDWPVERGREAARFLGLSPLGGPAPAPVQLPHGASRI